MSIARLSAVALVVGLTSPACAEDAIDFKGKTVTFISSFEAGGPYDFYTRLVARYIGPHLPGNPTVITRTWPAPAETLPGLMFRDKSLMVIPFWCLSNPPLVPAPLLLQEPLRMTPSSLCRFSTSPGSRICVWPFLTIHPLRT